MNIASFLLIFLKRMISKSLSTVIICISFIVGTFFASNLRPPFLLSIIIAIFLITLFIIQNKIFYYFLVIFGLSLGAQNHQAYLHKIQTNNMLQFENENISFQGNIINPPEFKNNKQYLQISSIKKDNKDINGKILVTTNNYPTYHFGDKIKVEGQILKPENSSTFSYQDYLLKNKIVAICYLPNIESIGQNQKNMYYYLFGLRDIFIQQSRHLFSPTIAALVNGILLGEKNQLSLDWQNIFREIGLSHIIVVSGYNLGIFATIFLKFLRGKVAKIYCLFITLGSISIFTMLTGAEASIVRALIMSIFLILAPFIGRKNQPTISILLAASIMIYLNPLILKSDASFHLSFLATIGLIYFPIYLEPVIERIKFPKSISTTLTETLSAQITTMPYIATSFGNISLISPLANILVLPLIPSLMFLSFLCIVLSFIIPAQLNFLLTFFVSMINEYILQISKILHHVPYHVIKINNLPIIYIISYYIIIILLIINRPINEKNRQDKNFSHYSNSLQHHSLAKHTN